MKNILIGFGVLSNIATLLGLWIAYAAAAASLQSKIGNILLVSGAGCSIVIYVVIVWWIAQKAPEATEPGKTPHPRVFFFSPGIAIALNRGSGSVVVNLHVLSTEQIELIYIRLVLTDTTGLRITCEHSEPMRIESFDLTAKSIEQKITSQEMEKFQRGMLVNIEGYAKFRDGGEIAQKQISLTTIPNI